MMCSDGGSAYSVLTHEEIVDLLWTDAIQPVLSKAVSGDWKSVLSALDQLKSVVPVPTVAGSPAQW
jgi:hypothetical protein